MGLCYRLSITLIDIIFPPLAVMIVCGCGWDLALNCLFFFLGILPGHIHGFYVTWTYFSRRRKVKKGRYPGGPKPLIESKKVIYGGASQAEYDRLQLEQNGGPLKGKLR